MCLTPRQLNHALIIVLLVTVLPPEANDAVGWRNKGDGHFDANSPPTSWSKDDGVLWKTKMPGRTYSSPIISGDYVITTAEPTELICLNRGSGEILWQRSHGYEDFLPA